MAKTIEEKIKDYISLTKEYKKGCKYDYETIINLDIYNDCENIEPEKLQKYIMQPIIIKAEARGCKAPGYARKRSKEPGNNEHKKTEHT